MASKVNVGKKQRGGITVEFAMALVMAASIAYQLIPLTEQVSKEVLEDTSNRISPHYP